MQAYNLGLKLLSLRPQSQSYPTSYIIIYKYNIHIHCVFEKRQPFYFCESDATQFCQFLAETRPRKFETKHIYRDHQTSLYMFALYLVKTSNDF